MAAETEKKSRTGRWLRVMLFVSLALNLLVMGAVAGFVVKGPPSPRGDRSDPVLPYTRAFDEEQRRALRRALWRSFPKDGSVRAAYLADYQQALGILRSDPFDRAALAALLTAQSERGAEARLRGQEVLMTFLGELSADERKAYADRLEEELDKMRHRKRTHDDGKGGHHKPRDVKN
ncbi:periplasmic heavy metal sensor [Mameliella alba]|nr:periplasmic heavy metal sensor [Antarctobacter heliothermus]MBY6143806.1 periplasmic heavy metal sensor [Mameliella alba]MBY6162460.1 periplasmic heavy metal sensor [Mameliella alba]MBY6170934.1 periplasmic heavy metal sensor [Mameliella alba]MBY6175947.1 periplasmic heavy metal sensor [Mameliella alba]